MGTRLIVHRRTSYYAILVHKIFLAGLKNEFYTQEPLIVFYFAAEPGEAHKLAV